MKFTKDDIIAALKMVFDPEIPVNVWDLGLIYDIEIVGARIRAPNRAQVPGPAQTTFAWVGGAPTCVTIKMTLTSPTCPMAEDIVLMVKQAAESVAGRGNAHVELIWDPPWTLDRMSPAARLELDLTEEGW